MLDAGGREGLLECERGHGGAAIGAREWLGMRAAARIEVVWRLASPSCRRLRGVLLDHGIVARWRNAAIDRRAMDLVEEHGGVVPLVLVGDEKLVDPSWAELAPRIGRDPVERPRLPPRRTYASPGACTPAASPRVE